MSQAVSALLRDTPLPRFVQVRQQFSREQLIDVSGTILRELSRPEITSRVRPGMRICLTCGSRGIDNYATIIRTVAAFCKERGALPFAVPAMGSHGGATAEGQREMLRTLGITEETIGCPIYSSMETTQIGTTEEGHPVRIDHYAAAADGIILINRIKPHTSFRGTYESGLMKMMAIGLGKQAGAQVCHKDGFPQMHRMVPLFGKAILANAPVLLGLGVIENAFDRTARVYALTAEEIVTREPELLKEAADFMPSLGFRECDVLVVDQIGKNISGCGMDPNITGRFAVAGMTGGIQAKRRCILSLTPQTHGNGYGMGAADAITRRVHDALDLDAVYLNAITSTSLDFCKIPLIMDSDREAIALCVRTCNGVAPEDARIIRIQDTLTLDTFQISENLLSSLPRGMEVISEPAYLPFREDGSLF